MAVAEQAQLVVAISLRDQFSPAVRKLQTNLRTLDAQTAQLQRGVGKISQGIGKGLRNSAVLAAGAVGLLATQVKAGITELLEWEDATLQVEAAIKSTNGVAGVNVKVTQELAEKYAALSLAEDDVILGAQSLLLRFPRITKDAFEPALAASLDLSQAMGTDLTSATKTVARALQDPIKGLSRLERAGVSFTEQEKKKIQRLQESGRQLDAQRIVLNRLNRVYGGSAERSTRGYRGQVKLLTDRIKDLQQALATPLLAPLTEITKQLTLFASSPEVKQGISDLGTGIAALVTQEGLASGFETIKSGFGFIRDLPWNTIKDGLQTTADVAKRAVDLFKGLPPEVQGALVTLLAANKLTGGLVASGLGDIASFLLRNLTTINAAVVNVIGASVNTGITRGAPTGGGAGAAIAKTLATATIILAPPIIAHELGIPEFLNQFLPPSLRLRDQSVPPTAPRRAQTSPGAGGMAARGFQLQMNVIDRLTRLAASSDAGNERASDIWRRIGEGNLTYQEAKKELAALRRETGRQSDIIARQNLEVRLANYVQVSATSTSEAITVGVGSRRIILKT